MSSLVFSKVIFPGEEKRRSIRPVQIRHNHLTWGSNTPVRENKNPACIKSVDECSKDPVNPVILSVSVR